MLRGIQSCIPVHGLHHRLTGRPRARLPDTVSHAYCALLCLQVPCPIDPSHTVGESKLKAHLKRCNKYTEQQREKVRQHLTQGRR